MTDCRVVFAPSGRRGVVPMGTTVLDAARRLGVDLDSVCGGRGLCGRCQVEQGSAPGLPRHDDALSPVGPIETTYRGRRPLTDGRRLGCAATIQRDLVIDVPAESQVHRQVVRKRPEVGDYPIDPVVRLHYVVVQPPTLRDTRSDLSRIALALEADWGLTDLTFDPAVMARVHAALVTGEWAITTAVHNESTVIAVWAGFHDRAYGVAFDVGSTTIAGHLLDLTTGHVLASGGMMNPQIRFGEDLMSRVSHVMMNPEGTAEMTAAVRGAMDSLIEDLVADSETSLTREGILDVTVVGNPIMHHLLLGIDPTPLGTAPFAPIVDDSLDLTAAHIDLSLNPGARLYILPLVAGHVGADTMGAVLSEGPHRRDDLQLLVDVGTNAEIVLGNRSMLLAASSPTGPAFEGAQISSGQRATPGAIERVRIDRHTLEPRIRVIGSDIWSDEDGFDEAVAATGVTGICGSGIIEVLAELFLSGVIQADGTISGSGDRMLQDGRTTSYRLWDDILITQNDVRAIQLGKAALYAGVQLLMDKAEVDRVDVIRLAGAFGSHIDPLYAMVLGLVPDCDLDRVSSAGNAAGSGAIIALLSNSARREVEEVASRVRKIETAVEPRFQEHFVAAMGIPHTSHTFPRLTEVIDIPAARPSRRRIRSRRTATEETV